MPHASMRAGSCRRYSTSTAALIAATVATSSFDAQGEFVGIVADVYRVSKDCTFLRSVFETTVRAVRFIEELCARTDALYGPDTRFSGLLSPSISHEGYNKPSFSYWDDFFALSAWRNCEWLANDLGELGVAAEARAKGDAFAAALTRFDPHDRGGHGPRYCAGLRRSRRRGPDRDRHRVRTLPGGRRLAC